MTIIEATSGLRIIPPALLHARRPQRMIERSIMVNRRTWLILLSGFFEPVFYLLSIRVGFGDLVGDVTVDEVHPRSRRVLLAVVEDDDPAPVFVPCQLGHQVACGGVPPADDDVVAVSRCTHALPLLEQEVDDGPTESPDPITVATPQ